MSEPANSTPIDVDEKFHRHEYWFEVVGGVVIALLMLASLLGVFGDGPLSRQTLATDQGMFEFERFSRARGQMTFDIDLKTAQHPLDITLPNSYLYKLEQIEITPQPLLLAGRENTVFRFVLTQTDMERVKIRFVFEPRSAGILHGSFLIGPEERLSFTQYVFP